MRESSWDSRKPLVRWISGPPKRNRHLWINLVKLFWLWLRHSRLYYGIWEHQRVGSTSKGKSLASHGMTHPTGTYINQSRESRIKSYKTQWISHQKTKGMLQYVESNLNSCFFLIRMSCVHADRSLQSHLTSWCKLWILPLPRTICVEDLAKNWWTFGQSSRKLSTRVCIRRIPSGTGAEVVEQQSQNKALSVPHSDHYSFNIFRVEH